MHPTAESFSEKLREEHGIEIDIKEFPEGTKTAEDAAEAIGCELGQIVKSIVMQADNHLILVLTGGENRVSEEKLAGYLDAEDVSSASPSKVKEHTGWSIGSLPPFCHKNSTDVIIDPALEKFDTVWAAAGTPEAVFSISPELLIDVARPETVDVFE
ncbi:MAG: YbaK/EbsC family protein [Candidatus Nanohaloarchaea archaeon]